MRNIFLISLLLIATLFSHKSVASTFKDSILNKDYDQLYIKLEQKVKIPIFIPMKKIIYNELTHPQKQPRPKIEKFRYCMG